MRYAAPVVAMSRVAMCPGSSPTVLFSYSLASGKVNRSPIGMSVCVWVSGGASEVPPKTTLLEAEAGRFVQPALGDPNRHHGAHVPYCRLAFEDL